MISLSGKPMFDLEEECDHEGMVCRGECEKCGERGLESDHEIYESECPQ